MIPASPRADIGYEALMSATVGVLTSSQRTSRRHRIVVQAENTPAHTAGLSWRFRVIWQVRPFDDSPAHKSLVKELTG